MTTPNRVRGNDPGEASRRLRENLKRVRMARGFTQAGLAEALADVGRPIPVASIAKIESGDRRVDVDDLAALAEALATPVQQLLADPSATLYDALIAEMRRSVDGALEALKQVESAAVNLTYFAEEHPDQVTPIMHEAIADWISMNPSRIAEVYRDKSLDEAAVEEAWQQRVGYEVKPEQRLTGRYWDLWARAWEDGDGQHPEAS